MPVEVAESHQSTMTTTTTTTTTQAVVFPFCCVGCSGGDPNKLKLIGLICAGLALIFSALVTGILNSSLYIEQRGSFCYYSGKNSNCEYARFCGGFSIALSLLFGALYGLRIKPIVSHPFLGTKAQLLGEIGAAAVMAAFFIICALVLSTASTPYYVAGSARAVSAFSYFATFSWVGLATIAYSLYKERESAANSSGNNPV